MYFGHDLILLSQGSQALAFADEGDGSGLQRPSCPGPWHSLFLWRLPLILKKRGAWRLSHCVGQQLREPERRHVERSELTKLHRRKEALDLFTFWEHLGPTENNCTGPLGRKCCCPTLFLTRQSPTTAEGYWCCLASGVTGGPTPGTAGLSPETVTLTRGHKQEHIGIFSCSLMELKAQ